MRLQKLVFLAGAALFVLSLMLTAIALIGIAVVLLDLATFNVAPIIWTLCGCVLLRSVVAVWLKFLGGVPEEFRPK